MSRSAAPTAIPPAVDGADDVKPTPLPRKRVLTACSAVYVNTFSQLVIFPFLPFMVHDFFPYLDESEVGYYAGFLASAYGVGDFCGSLLWAKMSDKHGRRPVLMMGLCGTFFSVLMFGFSWSYPWAICTRLIWGFLCAIVGVVKTYIAEVCDDTNQAKGFAIIGMIAGMGRLTGPSVGGLLSQPSKKYDAFKGVSLFERFPYLLPCMIAAVMALCALIFQFFFLVESKTFDLPSKVTSSKSSKGNKSGKRPKRRAYQRVKASDGLDSDGSEHSLEDGYALPRLNSPTPAYASDTGGDGIEMATIQDHHRQSSLPPLSSTTHPASQSPARVLSPQSSLPPYGDDSSSLHDSDIEVGLALDEVSSDDGVTLVQRDALASPVTSVRPLRLIDLLRERDIQVSTVLYGLLACVGTVTNELFALWVLNDLEHGGFGFESNHIGIALAATAPIQLTWQLFVYPRIVKRFGVRRTFRICLSVFASTCFIMPLSVAVRAAGASKGIQWATILTLLAIHITSRVTSFTTVFVLISNSCLPESRAKVNSIGQMMAAFTRTLGPAAGALTFAWSENSGLPFPFDFHLVWFVCGLWAIGMVGYSLRLPVTVDYKKTE